jgi:hypothetical protein
MMTHVGGVEPLLERMTELFSAIAAGWPGDTAMQRIRMVAIGHVMAYPTWKSLTDYGPSETEAADLMLRLVSDVKGPSSSRIDERVALQLIAHVVLRSPCPAGKQHESDVQLPTRSPRSGVTGQAPTRRAHLVDAASLRALVT